MTTDTKINNVKYVAIAGNIGAGKTTLLRLCAGELQPSAGLIAVDGGKDPRSVVSLMPQ